MKSIDERVYEEEDRLSESLSRGEITQQEYESNMSEMHRDARAEQQEIAWEHYREEMGYESR